MTASLPATAPDPQPTLPVLAAIDVGTNAVRLEIARPLADGRFETLHEQRDAIRPGEGLGATGEIPPVVAERLVATLRRYATICTRHEATTLRAVATSAVRDAKNRDLLVRRIRREAGIELEVISGAEEARLACLGALLGASATARSVCIDVGGGSTEVAAAIGDQPIEIWSVGLGAVGLTERFDARGGLGGDQLARLRRFAAETVAREIPGPVGGYPPRALGCSGSARSVIRFAAAEGAATVTTAELTRAVDALVAMGPEGRAARFDSSKADIVVAAAAILEALARHLQLESVAAADRGLRHGLIVDLHRRREELEFSRFSLGCHPSVTALS